MADQSILREYLMALGFKVDLAGANRFDLTVVDLGKKAGALGKTLVGVGLAAKAMVTAFSFQMEKLYYASKRAESSAANLTAFDFGARQQGIQNFRETLEGMARAIRMNPGLQGLLEQLGVEVTGRDRADVLMDLVEQLRKMPFYVASQYANLFGIDPDTLLLLQDGLDKMRETAEMRKRMAAEMGIDLDQATEVGRVYAQTMREIWERAGLAKDAIALQLLPAFQLLADQVNRILAGLPEYHRELVGVTGQVIEDWDKILKRVDMLNQRMEGSGWLDFAKRFFEGTGLIKPSQVTLSTEAQARVAAGETKALSDDPFKARQPGAPTAAPIVNPSSGVMLSKEALERLNRGEANQVPDAFKPRPGQEGPGRPQTGRLGGFSAVPRGVGPVSLQTPARIVPRQVQAEATPERVPLGMRQNNPGNLRSWGDAPRQSGFAVFQNSQQGLSALAGNLLAYYNKHGLRNLEEIISRYAPDSENDTAAYIRAVAQQLGVSSKQALDLKDPATLSALMAAIVKHEQGYNPYDLAEIQRAANVRLGVTGNMASAPSVTINQDTRINVQATNASPQEIGRQVAGVQREVNSDLGDVMRNQVGAVR